MQIKRKKRLIISLLLTLVIMLIAIPLYSQSNTSNYIRSLNSKEARLHIFYGGDKENKLDLVKSSKKIISRQPEWYRNPRWEKLPGQGTIVHAKISHQYRKIELSYRANKDGLITIYLLGPGNKWDNGKQYPVWVYYKNFKVNGQEIFNDTKKLHYNKGYENRFPIKKGETFSIEFEAKRHIPLNLVYGIEPLLFISCLAISFLLSRMVVYWLSQFKIREHHSRVDIVFLSVFFALLMIPMSHINQDEKSDRENRMLAKYVALINNQGHLNLKYGKDFEAWFNDHFNFRNEIIRKYNTLKYKLSQYFSGTYSHHEIYFAKDGWMFDNNETRRFLGFSPAKTDKSIQNLKKLKTYFEQAGIKFYFFISPSKGDIYAEYNTRYLSEHDKLPPLIETIYKKSGVHVYYPLDKYLKAKEHEMIFYKTDHHSTEYATWIAYQDLSAQIKSDFPQYHIVSQDEYTFEYDNKVHFEYYINQGASAERINVDISKKLDTQYKYFIPHNKDNIKINRISSDMYDYYNNKAPNNLRVMMIGNSFTENFVKFIPYSVKEMRKFRINGIGFNMKIIGPEIQKYKPDIVIFASQSNWISDAYTGNLPAMYD